MAHEIISAPRSTIWASAVNVWKIAIQHSLGRALMPVSAKEALQYFRQAGYRFLAVEPEHAAAVGDLAAYHQDPFDRLLVAQTLVEPMRSMTHDAIVARYSDTIILI